MTTAITGVDHCVILVRDLGRARERIADLGFTVTPRGVHSEHMGTHNHCIMLREGYFEILAVRKPTEHNARWRALVEAREGLSIVALQGEARAAYEALAARGVAPAEPIDFARPVELPEGEREAAFRVTVIPAEHTPGANMFVCEHFTRDVTWHPSYLDHENGARGLKAVTAVFDDPSQAAPAYAKIFGEGRVRNAGDAVTVGLGATDVRLLTPEGFAAAYPGVPADSGATPPYLAALTVESEDLGKTAACLDARGARFSRLDEGRLCIPPADACGTLFEFV